MSQTLLTSARLRGEAHALRWLLGVKTAWLLLVLLQAALPEARAQLGAAWALYELALVAGVASWAAAARTTLARVALGLLVAQWALDRLLEGGLLLDVLGGGGRLLEAAAWIKLGLLVASGALLAAALLYGTAARRRDRVDAGLTIGLVGLVAGRQLLVHGALWLDLSAPRAVFLGLAALEAGLFAALLYRRRGAALAEASAAEAAPADPSAWRGALGGIRLVRAAELTRAVAAVAVAVALLTGLGRGALATASLVGAVALVAALIAALLGLSRYRRLPEATAARGPAAAAMTLAAFALVTSAAALLVALASEGRVRGVAALESNATLALAGALVSLLWSARRVGQALADDALRARATLGAVLYGLAGLATVAPRLLGHGLRPGSGLGVALALSALALTIAAVATLLQTLSSLERAAERDPRTEPAPPR